MTNLSNTTLRAARILDYLVANPDHWVGLSSLARALDINKSTCLSILRSLSLTGYITEDRETKEYSLGPALLAAQAVISARWQALDPALKASRTLSQRLGLCVDLHIRVGGHLTVVDRSGPLLGPLQPVVRAGLRKPFVAPLGVSFIAWSTPKEYQDWMQPWLEGPSGTPILSPKELSEFTVGIEACIEACRSRGYLIELETTGLRQFQEEAGAQMGHPDYEYFARRAVSLVCSPEMLGYAVVDAPDDRPVEVCSITSPIVPSDGKVSIAISVVGFESPLTKSQIHEIGGVLAEETAKITAGLTGGPSPFHR